MGNKPKTLDAPPYLSDSGRTMLPFRFLGEALGAQVDWENSTRSVIYRLGGRTVTMRIGSPTATVDGRKVQLDSPPQLVNNRTMVPLRAISELLGARVEWDNNTRTASIYP
ncbi:hypothetical protein SY88_11760 [Clostridiales bacterium PH28_bin88]|nr:hypothetical protein SY88_11760 [Clostridiales bacterium PH28_bin88]